MLRYLWLHKLLSRNSRSLRHRQAAQQRKPVHLGLESLEDRVTPANTVVIDVTQTADSSTVQGTLRTAILQANYDTNADTEVINLRVAGTYNLAIANAGAEDGKTGNLVIRPNHVTTIKIEGFDTKAADTVINQTTLDRVLQISKAGVNVVLENLTIKGGHAFDNGTAYKAGFAQGGGILNLGGNVTLNNVVVTSNSATASDSLPGQGGGIYSSGGSLTINTGTVQNNIARGGPVGIADADGGGIFAIGGPVTLNTVTVTGNKAIAGATSGAAQGGGVSMNGIRSDLPMSNSALSITNSKITNNLAQAGNNTAANKSGYAVGGGLFVTGSTGSSLTIDASQIANNTANGGAGAAGAPGAKAGFAGAAGGTGGAALGGGAFIGTVTVGGEGGVSFGAAPVSVRISASPFTGNTATAGGGGTGGAGAANPGGAGGAGGVGGAGGTASGGGLWSSTDVPGGTIVNSSFTDNKANSGAGGGGGAGATGKTGGGGGIGGAGGGAAGGGATLFGQMSLINSTSATNQANAGAGGAGGPNATLGTAGPGAQGFAGGGGIRAGGTGGNGIRLINNTVVANQANGSISSTGGGIYATGNTTLINNIAVDNTTSFTFDTDRDINGGNQVIRGGRNTNLTTPSLGSENYGLPVVGAPLTTGNGVVFYQLLPGSPAINAGSNEVLPEIARAEGVTFNPQNFNNIRDIVGSQRVINGVIDQGAVEFSQASFASVVTVSPATINTSGVFQPLNVQATVTSPGGIPVDEGTVSFSLIDPTTGKTVGGPVTGTPNYATNGKIINFSATLTVPANIKPGTYTIVATYTDPFTGDQTGKFSAGQGTAPLTVNPAPTPASTTLTPGSASITTSSSAQPVGVTVLVGSPSGTVNTGTVTVTLLNNGVPVPGATDTKDVRNGSASLTITVPGGLAPGSYTFVESYHDASGAFADSSGFGTLTVSSKGTTLVPGNATVPFSTTAQPAGVPVIVTSTSGTVNQGTATVNLLVNGVVRATASNTVSNGSTVVTIQVPAGLAAGSYTLLESYHDPLGMFGDSSNFGTLTVTPPPPPPPVSPPSPLPVTVTNNVPVTVTNPPSPITALIALFYDGALLALNQLTGTSNADTIADIMKWEQFAGPLGPQFVLAGFQAVMNSSKHK